MSELEPKLSPENLFNYDYVNEFIGLDMTLQMLKSGAVDIDFLRSGCAEAVAQKGGRAVLKFSEKYNIPAPASLDVKIKELDVLVDKINMWIEEFLKDKDSKNIDELAEVLVNVFNIMKPPRKTK